MECTASCNTNDGSIRMEIEALKRYQYDIRVPVSVKQNGMETHLDLTEINIQASGICSYHVLRLN
jgi:hypothetical protein